MTDIKIERHDSHCVVVPPQRVDVTNAAEFLNSIKDEIRSGNTNIVLDLTDTRAIDSTALGALVQVYKWSRIGEGDLRLASPSDGVKRLLSLTRLDKVFDLHDSIEDAVLAFH